MLYTLESGSGPAWGVCRFGSDDTDAPSPAVSFTLAAVGAGFVGIASLPFLCLSPSDAGVDPELTSRLMG